MSKCSPLMTHEVYIVLIICSAIQQEPILAERLRMDIAAYQILPQPVDEPVQKLHELIHRIQVGIRRALYTDARDSKELVQLSLRFEQSLWASAPDIRAMLGSDAAKGRVERYKVWSLDPSEELDARESVMYLEDVMALIQRSVGRDDSNKEEK